MVLVIPISRCVALKYFGMAENAVARCESLVGMGSLGVEAELAERFVGLLEDRHFARVDIVVDYLVVIFWSLGISLDFLWGKVKVYGGGISLQHLDQRQEIDLLEHHQGSEHRMKNLYLDRRPRHQNLKFPPQ